MWLDALYMLIGGAIGFALWYVPTEIAFRLGMRRRRRESAQRMENF